MRPCPAAAPPDLFCLDLYKEFDIETLAALATRCASRTPMRSAQMNTNKNSRPFAFLRGNSTVKPSTPLPNPPVV
jgi:hypothetical protein